jgi:D-alanine-D-alanine ligase
MEKKRPKKVGVLMGGTSSEREVSLKSGNAVYKALKSLKYRAVRIDAADDLCETLKNEKIDLAFIALHGGHGENGAVQGMLEILNIPYTGSGILASALAMDKEASKKVFRYHGIPMPPFKIIQKSEFGLLRRSAGAGNRKSAESVSRNLHFAFDMPWVIKPASEGSSVGVEIVREKSDIEPALRQAFEFGDRVIVEKYIAGKEIQIGILNNTVLGGVEVRPSLEFYNYEAKYTAGLTEYILPPHISKQTYSRTAKAALAAHMALGCSGATRVDLIVDQEGNSFVLEVNTIPGMTETSLLPKIAAQAGLEFSALIEAMLKL